MSKHIPDGIWHGMLKAAIKPVCLLGSELGQELEKFKPENQAGNRSF